MISLLASIGIGGSLGTIIAILENPATGIILKFAKKAVIALSQGKHLSEAEKQFIKDYNHQEVMVYGHDFSDQLKIANLMRMH